MGARVVFDRAAKIYETGRKTAALSDLSLVIDPGEFVAVVGPSGCGKSTLLHLAGGIDRPTSGSVEVDGRNLSEMAELELCLFRRRSVGTIFQFFNLIPALSVLENIALPLDLDDRPEAMDRARELLERVGLPEKAAAFPYELSGGQMQRVAVARAVAARPPLLLADEPTGNLDSVAGEEVLTLVDELRRSEGATVIIATHSAEAARRADRMRPASRRTAGMSLLRRGLIVRPMLARPRRLLVSISGIAIGVASVAAIHRANQSVTRSFEDAVDFVAGRTDLSVSGIDGVPESAGTRLAWLWAEGGSFAPTIDRFAIAADGTDDPVEVLGVDVTSEAPVRTYNLLAPRSGEGLRRLFERDTVLAPLTFVRRHNLKLGSRVDLFAAGRRRSVTIAGILDLDGPARASGGSVLVAGLRTAERMFDIEGRVDRIDIRLPRTADRNRFRARVAAALPPGLSVAPPRSRSETAGKMVRAFRFNLAALGSIALLVGMFLIYNTVSLSVLRRRSEIGTLRALGASKGSIFRAFLFEGSLLGAAGTIVGLGLGALLSKAALGTIGGTVENIYMPTASLSLSASPAPFILAAISGLMASIFSALRPAAEAASIDPASTMRAGSIEGQRRLGRSFRGAVAIGLCVIGGFACLAPAIGGFPFFGFFAIGCGVAALAAASGPAVSGFETVTRRGWALAFGAPGRLASSFFAGNASRNSIAVAALSLSLGMTAAMAVMIASLKSTVDTWISQSATADLMIKSATGARRGVIGTIPAEAIVLIRAVPGVAAADPFRALDSTDARGNPFTVASGDFGEAARLGGLPLLSHGDSSQALAQARRNGGVFVSEPYARKFGKWRGDRLTLATPSGPMTFRVEDVYSDYSNDRGTVVMDRPVFLALFHDAAVSSVAIGADRGVSPEELRSRILAACRGRFALSILTSRTLRREVTRIFDRTFAVTWALEGIAMAVAVLGVFHALIALTLERQRELSLLKILGTSRRQLSKAIVLEAALLALASLCLAAVAAAALAAVLIRVINLQAFGWTIRTAIPWSRLSAAFVLVFLATLGAAAMPARLALAIDPARGMREE